MLIELRDENGLLHCNCDQKCLDLKISYDIQPQHEADIMMGIIMTYSDFPVLRYRRKIMFTAEDLLSKYSRCGNIEHSKPISSYISVSVGGTAGLFTGFCVLGAFDIFYYSTLRLFWFIVGRR